MNSNLCTFIGSEFFGNLVAFTTLVVGTIALWIGKEKANEVLSERRKRKERALGGYYANLEIFILRLIHVTTAGGDTPLDNLYLFSGNDDLKRRGVGCEFFAERLKNLSGGLLDYLSTKDEQIPAGDNGAEWEKLKKKLINDYLLKFELYDSHLPLPNLNDEKEVMKFHQELLKILDRLLKLIDIERKRSSVERRNSIFRPINLFHRRTYGNK